MNNKMYPTKREILMGVLLFGLYGIMFSDFVAGSLYSKVPDIKDIPKPKKLLTFLTPFAELFVLKHTGKSIDLDLLSPNTVGVVFGGVLGDKIYRLHKFRFFWQDESDLSWNGTRLHSRIMHYDSKYGSFKNALNYPDGIIEVVVPIETNGHVHNPLYWGFEEIMKTKIKKTGDQALINGGVSYVWYEYFTYQNDYISYSGSTYYDDETDKTYSCVITIELPLNRLQNFMSQEQFKNTFGSLKDCSGKPLTNPGSRIQHSLPPIEDKGICIINLPA